jgi:glyoxylase I family protein
MAIRAEPFRPGAANLAPVKASIWAQLTVNSYEQRGREPAAGPFRSTLAVSEEMGFSLGLWGVRYQVKDVQRSIDFYTLSGFHLDRQQLPAFGQVSIGGLKLILSGPGASGSRPMPGGLQQEPGGWNRVVLEVKDLPATVTELKNRGVRFRNEMESGPGGRQVQIEDPDGNPIELFEPGGQ